MAAMTRRQYSFSTLLREPNTVTAGLEAGDVIIERRDGEDFVIRSHRLYEQESRALAVLSWSLSRLNAEELMRELVADDGPMPWVRFLPDEDRVLFMRELVSVFRAAADVGRFAAVIEVLDQWRNTAEVWADPELAASLARSVDEPVGTPVEAP